MGHNCVDWTAGSPARKLPVLVLSWGDDHVYATVPKDFKALAEVARKEFSLGNCELEFYSSCINLCSDTPARISENAWEHISPYIGCVSVAVRGLFTGSQPNAEASAEKRISIPEPPKVVVPAAAQTRETPNENKEDENEHSEPDEDAGRHTPKKTIREEEAGNGPEDDNNAAPEYYSQEEQDEDSEEEEVSAVPPKSRRNRRVLSEDEEESEVPDPQAPPKPKIEEPELKVASDSQKRRSQAKSPAPPVASPPKPSRPLSREIKKERDTVDDSSQRSSQSAEPSRRLSGSFSIGRPIKQEKQESEARSSTFSHDETPQPLNSQSQSQPQTQSEPSDNQRLMIRVAHRASRQESKFTTKSSTKVAKVISGACKSFGLDATRAKLYLIVSMDDEENLFPCDGSDTMARAGAEHEIESKFLLKISGDP
ncbi:hypothetical protein HYDPIDRAFT_27293 [Hydnomerulius pinastri MD-312]|nr:hypothetical protein HYDPIDRAFT_27293 [Hydnomerulius pinastri MD-312]